MIDVRKMVKASMQIRANLMAKGKFQISELVEEINKTDLNRDEALTVAIALGSGLGESVSPPKESE